MGWPFDELLVKIYIPYFHQHGEAALKFLVEGQISSKSFLSVYKEMPPIEELSDIEKKKLKETAIALFPEKSVEELVSACKIIYSIGTISQYVNE